MTEAQTDLSKPFKPFARIHNAKGVYVVDYIDFCRAIYGAAAQGIGPAPPREWRAAIYRKVDFEKISTWHAADLTNGTPTRFEEPAVRVQSPDYDGYCAKFSTESGDTLFIPFSDIIQFIGEAEELLSLPPLPEWWWDAAQKLFLDQDGGGRLQ